MTNWIGYCSNQEDTCIAHWERHESETREEAIVPLAQKLDLLPGEKIDVGVGVDAGINYAADGIAEYIIETIDENAEVGECGDPPSEYLKDEDVEDLVARVKAMIDAWVADRSISTHYTIFEDVVTFTIPDYLDGHDDGAIKEATRD